MPDRWRLGSHNPFTVYRVADGAHDVDHAREHFVGSFRREEDARRAVDAVNGAPSVDEMAHVIDEAFDADFESRMSGGGSVSREDMARDAAERVTDLWPAQPTPPSCDCPTTDGADHDGDTCQSADSDLESAQGELNEARLWLARRGVDVKAHRSLTWALNEAERAGVVGRPATEPTGSAVGQRGAPTRDVLVAQFDDALFYNGPDGASVFRWLDGRFTPADEPMLAGLAERMADVALAALRDGGADTGGEGDGALRSLAAAVTASDEAPDMGLAWLTEHTRAETEQAFAAGNCVLGKCVDGRYPDAVCEHVTDDYRQEVVRLRRVVDRIGATNITQLSRRYRALCKDYGRASTEIARLRGELARMRSEEREDVTKLRGKVDVYRQLAATKVGPILDRLSTALGVSLDPDDPDPVGTLEAAAGKAREVEVVTSKQAVALPPGSWVLRCHQNGTPWLNASPRPADAIGSAGDPRWLVLYRAPAPAPAALAVGEVVESAADLATRVVDGVAVRDAKHGVLDYWDGHWHLTGMSGGPVVPAMPVRVLDVPEPVVRIGTGGGGS